jgi:hypothetical protein
MFLSSRPMFYRTGTRFLQETLSELLGRHIKAKLPDVRSFLEEKAHEIDTKLKEKGYFVGAHGDLLKRIYRSGKIGCTVLLMPQFLVRAQTTQLFLKNQICTYPPCA